MPTAYVKKMAEKHNKSVADMEKEWDRAKEQAVKENQKDNYAYITSIFNKMIGEKDGTVH